MLASSGLHTRIGIGAREIGYWVNSRHLRKGVATEIVCALTKIAFEVEGLNYLEIHCDVKNELSSAVAQKEGFTFKGILPANAAAGFAFDAMNWEMTKDDYPASPAKSAVIQAFNACGEAIM